MRDVRAIDSELRLLVAVRHAIVSQGGPPPSLDLIDELLDERAARMSQARPKTEARRLPTTTDYPKGLGKTA